MPRTLKDIRGFMLDMDGTFYVSDKLMPHARDLLTELQSRDIPFIFLTNNSSARAEDYQAKLARLEISVPLDRILTSGQATVRYMQRYTEYKRVFLLGTPALEDEFTQAGFELTDKEPDCVVLGFDKTLHYEKLKTACFLLAEGLPYLATHPDDTCITTEGLIPDIGSFMAAIDRVVHRWPKVIGKPMPEMVEAALERIGTDAEHTAMVGDQLDTDMTMAKNSGLFGVLLMSGETSKEQFENQNEIKPDLVFDHIGQLYEQIVTLPKD